MSVYTQTVRMLWVHEKFLYLWHSGWPFLSRLPNIKPDTLTQQIEMDECEKAHEWCYFGLVQLVSHNIRSTAFTLNSINKLISKRICSHHPSWVHTHTAQHTHTYTHIQTFSHTSWKLTCLCSCWSRHFQIRCMLQPPRKLVLAEIER